MTAALSDVDLKVIQQAIDVEIKHCYINISGNSSSFADFIKKQLSVICKKSKKNPKWLVMLKAFEYYHMESMPARKKIIDRLIKTFRAEIEDDKIKPKQDTGSKNPQDCDVMYVKGVGPKFAYLLNKMQIYTAADLLEYYPKKYIDYSKRIPVKNLKKYENVTVFGYISSVQGYITKKNLAIITVAISDDSGVLKINFFYAKVNKVMLERYKSQFPKGSAIMISGNTKPDSYTGKITIDKPQYQLVGGDFYENKNLHLGRIVPIYALIDGLNIKNLRTAINNAIIQFENDIADELPLSIVKKFDLMSKITAVKEIHFPSSMETKEKARYRLVFEELFLLQQKLIQMREANNHETNLIPMKLKEDGLVQTFINNLPFELTNSQKEAVNEILKDLSSGKIMQRLLQGDVGSGKTVVAVISILNAIENGYQTAIMAPTEILAQQHYNNIIDMLTPLGLSVGLFLGNNSKSQRNKLETNLKNGQMHVAVGTHALIQENVHFKNLGLIVIDEQHRFGVKQREKLKEKGYYPQVLCMSATPIPRTLALTLHGDLDLTVMTDMPKGRLPIKTSLFKSGQRKEVYKLIENEVKLARQVYIVYPLIDESETVSAKAATVEAQKLQNEIFPDFRIGLLHGKLKPQEKDAVMSDFKNARYDILVSTTVVEVGVDVANATLIVIENAERFGLSQLHQLRGRVGRSDIQSYCAIVSSSKSPETLERLNALTQTNDGFVIAEKDLQIRGPGEYLGTRQSGIPDLAIADLTRDIKILEEARHAAIELFQEEKTKKPSLI